VHEKLGKEGDFMGFGAFLKRVFSLSGGGEDDAELRAARARHGIAVGEKDEKVDKKDEKKYIEPEPYDPWEEIRNLRTNFWFGSWVTRKFRVIGEDKVKKELADLEKKREEERKSEEEEKRLRGE